METMNKVPLSGRKAQAARNDQLILEAARKVFLANPEAPISAVAAEAGVGISALYRRYRSKEDLLQTLFLDGLRRYIAAAEASLADSGDPRAAFASFLQRSIDAGANSLSQRMAGSFAASEELQSEGYRSYQLSLAILDRAKAAGVLRPEIEVGDLAFIFEQVQSVQVRDPERTRELRQRYLALHLDALCLTSAPSLPGPAPTWPEISSRYDT